MNLVILITIVVEDLSDQSTPHQLRVSMFDLKQEDKGRESMRKVSGQVQKTIWLFKTVNIKLYKFFFVFFESQTKEVFKSLTDGRQGISTSDQQMSQECAG